MGNRSGCLICGKPLEYYDTEREMTCAICGKRFPSAAGCVDGHYICEAGYRDDSGILPQKRFQKSHHNGAGDDG